MNNLIFLHHDDQLHGWGELEPVNYAQGMYNLKERKKDRERIRNRDSLH